MKSTIKTAASAAVTAVSVTRSGFAESAQSTQANSKAGIIAIAYGHHHPIEKILKPIGRREHDQRKRRKKSRENQKALHKIISRSLGLTWRGFRSTSLAA
jgi:translation initiation factor IF-3